MERLPPEVGEHSFVLVSLKDLCSLVLTSSRVRTLASNPVLWKNMRLSREKIKQEGLAKLFSIKRFSKIRKIDLSMMIFGSEELQSNLKAISSSCVEDLNIEFVNLSEVPVDLLAQTVGHVRKINLSVTELTTPQCIAVLRTCVSSPTLVHLSLGVNLLEVPAALLGEAAAHLHSLNLCSSSSTPHHCRAVLQSCIGSSALVDVSFEEMAGMEVASMEGVPPSLLYRAAANLKRLNLNGTELTTEQSIAVLETCTGTSPLVYLNMGNLQLEEVPSLLIKRAVGHLHELDLVDSDLTIEQCFALLEACIATATSKIVVSHNFHGFLVPDDLLDLLDEARDTGRITEL